MHRRTFLSLLGAAPIAAPLALATGAPGPVGPQGPSGPTGPTGVSGQMLHFSNCILNFPNNMSSMDIGDIVQKDGKVYVCVDTVPKKVDHAHLRSNRAR